MDSLRDLDKDAAIAELVKALRDLCISCDQSIVYEPHWQQRKANRAAAELILQKYPLPAPPPADVPPAQPI